MKKFLSLMALLMVTFTTALAENVKVTWTMGEDKTGVAEPATAATDMNYSVGKGLIENGTSKFGDLVLTRFDQNVGDDKGTNNHDSALGMGKYVDFSFTPAGGDFTPTKVSFDLVKNGTGDPQACVDFIDGEGNVIAVANNVTIIRNNETGSSAHSYDVSGAVSSSGAVTLRILIGKLGSGKSVGIANVAIEGEIVSADTPVLTATKEVNLKSYPLQPAPTATISLTGKNLQDGIYYPTMPEVEGLTISPVSYNVTNGVVNQEFTLTYAPTADAEWAEAGITFVIGQLQASTQVYYEARIKPYEQTIVSQATAWDWTTLSEEVELSDETVPSIADEFLFKELEDQIDFAEFDAQSIIISNTQFPSRKGKFQNGTIKFKTSVAGVITVDFSDTGSNGDNPAKRFLRVNGEDTEFYTQRDGSIDRKVSGEIPVPAGEVSITGWDPEAKVMDESGAEIGTGANVPICIYKVTFVPTEAPQPVVATFDFTSTDFRGYMGESLTDTKGYIYNETYTVEGTSLQITAGSAPSRIYADAKRGNCLVTYKEYTTLTFRAPEGKAITKIEFTAAGSSNINKFEASSGTIEGMVWTGCAYGVRFLQGGTSYLANAIVTLEDVAAAESLPEISYVECASIADFNALEAGTYAKVSLNNAEVIGKSADGYSTVWLQDATAGVWVQYTSLNTIFEENTKVNGVIFTVKREASGNPQMKEAENTPFGKVEAEPINEYTVVEGATISEVNVPANLNRVVKLSGATLEMTKASAGVLTLGTESISVNNGNESSNQQLYKIADWAEGTTLEGITIVGILVAKSKTENQLLPISIENLTDGINDISSENAENGVIYNLQGVRMNKVQKGLNIVDGKKMIVK